MFVARNGQSFFASLLEKEARNDQFEFLMQDHHLFSLFTKLVDQYAAMLNPPEDMNDRLNSIKADKYYLLEQAKARTKYLAYQKKLEVAKRDQEAKTRDIFYAIDWQGFTVVETLTLEPEDYESSTLPRPVTKDILSSMTLTQKKQQLKDKMATMNIGDQILGLADGNDMDIGDDDEEYADAVFMNADPSQQAVPAFNAADYVPRALQQMQAKPEQYHICPRCNQKIHHNEIQEHLQQELLDPKWKEQKELYERKFANVATTLDYSQVSTYLAGLAKHRTDIFSSEGASSQLPTSQAPPSTGPTNVVWDGTKASVEKTLAAKKILSHHEQLREISAAQAQVQEQLKLLAAKKGPSVSPAVPILPSPPIAPQTAFAHQATTAYPSILPMPPQGIPIKPLPTKSSPLAAPMMPMPPPMMYPFMPAVPMVGAFPSSGVMPYPMFNPTHMSTAAPTASAAPSNVSDSVSAPGLVPILPLPTLSREATTPAQILDQSSKKAKVDLNVVQIKVPQDPSKSEWNFNGQLISISLFHGAKTTIEALKDKISLQLNKLPPSRQKLMTEVGVVLKNTQTLSELDIDNNTILYLGLRERGGKK